MTNTADTGSIDLQSLLPVIVPKAIAWARRQEEKLLFEGLSLTGQELQLAARVGVKNPRKIRVLQVQQLPAFEDDLLDAIAKSTGAVGPDTIGLTLGYGIFICHGHRTPRLVSHECRHVAQYEEAGSIDRFLPVYLKQLAQHGYRNAPLEIDARTHEVEN